MKKTWQMKKISERKEKKTKKKKPFPIFLINAKSFVHCKQGIFETHITMTTTHNQAFFLETNLHDPEIFVLLL